MAFWIPIGLAFIAGTAIARSQQDQGQKKPPGGGGGSTAKPLAPPLGATTPTTPGYGSTLDQKLAEQRERTGRGTGPGTVTSTVGSQAFYYELPNGFDSDVMVNRGKLPDNWKGMGPPTIKNKTKKLTTLYKNFWGIPTGAKATSLQKRLLSGGFYPQGIDKENIKWGTLTAADFEAYKSATQLAAYKQSAGQDLTLNEVIDEAAQAGNAQAAEAQIIQISNPENVKDIVQTTASELIGEGVDEDIADAITAKYMAHEKGLAGQQREMTAAGQGGNLEEPIKQEVLAEQELRKRAPQQVGETAYLAGLGAWEDLLGRTQ